MKEKGLKLVRALYELKHSPNLWYSDFVATLRRLDLYQVPGANCLYANQWLTVLFYVDDIQVIYSAEHSAKFQVFESKLLREYEIRSLGEMENFLGIRLVRDRGNRKIWLSLDAAIEKMASRYNVPAEGPFPHTSLPHDFYPYNFGGKASQGGIYMYQQKVGSINYIAINTRPDIARTASKLSQFL